MPPPDLSIVVAVYNMGREAPRTLHSLSCEYQREVEMGRYEVIVVDNGSDPPLGEAEATRHGENFRYEFVSDAPPSPAAAMNRGASLAAGRWLGLMIDGARILSPGVVSLALSALERGDEVLVDTIGFHLGPDAQPRSIQEGYDVDAEDALLDSVQWPADGYRLFDIASLAYSSSRGWHGPISESNCMFLAAERFERLGGFDQRFDAPGGGFVNLDFYRRALHDQPLELLRLAGEASFHQLHGGAATSLSPLFLWLKWRRWKRQYRRIRGEEYRPPTAVPSLYGTVGPQAARWITEPETAGQDRSETRKR